MERSGWREAVDLVLRGSRSANSLESQHLDFKTDKGSTKETWLDLSEAAVCFANAGGGTLVVGVADVATGPAAFVGTTLTPEVLRAKIHALTDPAIVVTVDTMTVADSRLLVVHVPEGLDVYSTTKGLVTRRWGTACLPMRPADVSRLDDERRGADWTSVSSGRAVSDAEPDAMARVRSLLRGAEDSTRRALGGSSNDDLLNGLRLIHQDGTLTRAGEIMLCRDAVSAADVVLVYQYRHTPGGEAAFARRWTTPLVVAFVEVMEAITARVGMTPVNTASGQQLQVGDYPLVAVREALANALIHGDYRERRPVQIEHSPDTLTVRSPGPLVAGITPENILTAGSRARFPLLAAAYRTLGLAEELGQGVDRMFREMARTGRSTPLVEVDPEGPEPSTTVVLSGGPPNIKIVRFTSELPDAERNDTDTLLIVHMLCRRKTVTAQSVAPVVQRSPQATESILRRLSSGEAQILEPTAGTINRSHPSYRLRGGALAALGSAVTYHRRSTGEVDRKVIDHVREYETINSATVQRLFDVDGYQARDLLQDLVGREILVRTSQQRRGPAVKYGPGPQFPARRRKRPASPN